MMGHFTHPYCSVYRILVSAIFSSLSEFMTSSAQNSLLPWLSLGSTSDARDRWRSFITSWTASLQDWVSHSFEQEKAHMASVRTRSETLNISIAARLGLTGLSECKVIHLNVQGGPSPSQTLPRHCLQYLGQAPSEGSLRLSGELMWGGRAPQK